MDSLFTLLQNKDFDQPPEVAVIKDFVRKKYQADVHVRLSPQTIVMSVQSASLANSLRFDLPELKKSLQTDKRLSLRIGGT